MNLDIFRYISFGLFKELSGVIFSVKFILPNVTHIANLKTICIYSTES